MSALDALLKADTKKLVDRPTAKVEIPRLTKALGAKFEVTLRGLPGQLLADLAEGSTERGKHGEVIATNSYKSGLDIVINGTIDPDFKDKKLMEKLSVVTPRDAIEKLLLPGEIGELAKKVTELCGVTPQHEVDETVKN